jgi:hypothetical protein
MQSAPFISRAHGTRIGVVPVRATMFIDQLLLAIAGYLNGHSLFSRCRQLQSISLTHRVYSRFQENIKTPFKKINQEWPAFTEGTGRHPSPGTRESSRGRCSGGRTRWRQANHDQQAAQGVTLPTWNTRRIGGFTLSGYPCGVLATATASGCYSGTLITCSSSSLG